MGCASLMEIFPGPAEGSGGSWGAESTVNLHWPNAWVATFSSSEKSTDEFKSAPRLPIEVRRSFAVLPLLGMPLTNRYVLSTPRQAIEFEAVRFSPH